MENHQNDDVKVVKFNREKTAYLPHGLDAFFVNIDQYYVMNSRLQYIFRKDFKGFEKLIGLSLYRNRIEEVPEDAFYDLTELKMLSFFSNKIKEIPLTLFHNLRNLEYLSFAHNEISHIPSSIFQNCKKFQTIILHHNKIAAISADFILNLPNLLDLYLERNECIDKDFEFDQINPKNTTVELINKSCHGLCYEDSVVIRECSKMLETCKENVQNSWDEKKCLDAF
jgi:BspA type Leucine rich repeat region (6 copies)